jgi:hypothetical protein
MLQIDYTNNLDANGIRQECETQTMILQPWQLEVSSYFGASIRKGVKILGQDEEHEIPV